MRKLVCTLLFILGLTTLFAFTAFGQEAKVGEFEMKKDETAQTNLVVGNSSFQVRQGIVTPGVIATAYTKLLKTGLSDSARSVPLPIQLGEPPVRVTIEDFPTGLFYVGDSVSGQINFFFLPRTEWVGRSVLVKILQADAQGVMREIDSGYVAVEKFSPGIFTANSAGSGVPLGVYLTAFLTGERVYAPMIVRAPSGALVPAVFALYANPNIKQYAVLTVTGGMFLPETGLQGLRVRIRDRYNLAKVVYLGPFGFTGAEQCTIEFDGPGIINAGFAKLPAEVADCTLEDSFGNVYSRFQLSFRAIPLDGSAVDDGGK